MAIYKEILNRRGFIPRSVSIIESHALLEPFRILQDQRVNQINQIYRNKKSLCRRVARHFYNRKADYEWRKASCEKINQDANPWPFEIDKTVSHFKPIRVWEWPRDTEAIHVFLMLFRDKLMPADSIITSDIREICPQLILDSYYTYNSRFLRRDMESLLAYATDDKKFQGKPSSGVKDPQDEKSHGRKKKDVQDRFQFNAGQVLFDEKDLQIPTGLACEVLEKLVHNFGKAVKYSDLDSNSDDKAASEQLRTAKHKIAKIIEVNEIPCEIHTKNRNSYAINALKFAPNTAKQSSKTRHK